MSYALKKRFRKPEEVLIEWEKFIKPYINEDNQLIDKTRVPHLYAFADECKCTFKTLENYASKPEYAEFHEVMEMIDNKFLRYYVESGFLGNPFANFILSRKKGWIEIQKRQMEEDKESIALLEKFNRMSNEEFEEEFKKNV